MVDNSQHSLSKCGKGTVEVQNFGSNSSRISALSSSYPLRLISPRLGPNRKAALVFTLSYGGGLVSGDQISLDVLLLENSRLGLLTQGSTKIYKNHWPSMSTRQSLNATIREGAALLILPDPVQPFKDSVCQQRQIFKMHPKVSSLLLLDWVSEGRRTRDEAWTLSEYTSRNELRIDDGCASEAKPSTSLLLLRDTVKLRGRCPVSAHALRDQMEDFMVFGSIIIRGPLFEGLGKQFLSQHASKPRVGEKDWTARRPSDPAEPKKAPQDDYLDIIWTAAERRDCVVMKFGARTVDQARRWLKGMLIEDGTIEREFGEEYMLCLQDR